MSRSPVKDAKRRSGTPAESRITRVEEINRLEFEEFEDYLYRGFMDAEEPVDAERHKVMAECDSMFLGGENQFLVRSEIDGFPLVEDRAPDEVYFTDDQFGPLVESNCTQFVRSRGVLKFAAPPGSDDAEGVARVATSVYVYYQEKLLRQDFLQREARRLMLHGGAWRYVFYDPQAGGKVKTPKRETVEQPLADSAFYCPKCGAQGPQSQLDTAGAVPQENTAHVGPMVAERPHCPDCGYDDLVLVDVPPSTFEADAGEMMQARGDLVCDQPDGYEMTTNSWARAWDETITLRRRRRLDEGVLQSLFQYAELEEVDAYGTGAEGIRYQRHLEATFDPVEAIEASRAAGPVRFGREREYVEVWYMPVHYQDYVLPADFILYEGTPDEERLEAGTPLIDYFPDGMRVCKSGTQILGLFNEDFHDKFVYYRYRVAPGRFYGKGVEGACPLQRWLNELVSFVMTFLMTSGAPAFLYDETAMPDGMPPAGTPSQRIPVGNRPMDVSLDEIIKIVPTGQMSMGVFEMFTRVKEEMQAHMGAFSFFAGSLPDAAKATATGLSIVQEQASGLMMMPLALRAEADARFGELVVELFRRHIHDDRYVQIAGPYSDLESDGFFVAGQDLPLGITATVEPNSYYPRLSYQLRQDALDFFAWRGEFMQTHGRAPDPTEERLMADRFGVPEVINRAMIAGRIERQNFEAMKDYIDRFETGELSPEEQYDLVVTMQQQTEAAIVQAQQMAADAVAMGGMPPPIAEMLPQPEDIVIEKALAIAPIWPEQEEHLAMIEWLKRYANQDRGIEESPLVRQLIEKRIRLRKQAAAQVMAQDQADIARAMQPEMDRQMAVANEQAAAQQAIAGQGQPQEGQRGPSTALSRTQGEQSGDRQGAKKSLPALPYQRARGGPAQAASPVG